MGLRAVTLFFMFFLSACALPPEAKFEDLTYTTDDKDALIALWFNTKLDGDMLYGGSIIFQEFDPDSFQFTDNIISKKFCEGCSFNGSLKSYMSTNNRPFQVGKLTPGFYAVRRVIYKELFYQKSPFLKHTIKTSHFCINQGVEVFSVKAGLVNAIELGSIEMQNPNTANEVQSLFKLITINTETETVKPVAIVSFKAQDCDRNSTVNKNEKFELIKLFE